MKAANGDRQEQLERRLESLESVMAELNVFLARLSAEVLSLKVAAGATARKQPLSPSPGMRGNPHSGSNLFDHAAKVVVSMANLESMTKHRDSSRSGPDPDLQQETIESYSFHDQEESKLGGSSSSSSGSDQSCNGSLDASIDQPPRIPIYRGERNAEIIWQWIDKVEDYFRIGQASPNEKVLIATYHLKDAAYFWWKNSSSSSLRSTSWEDFRRAFIKSFMPVNYLREAKFALMDLRQNKSVREYSSMFCRLASRVPGLSEEDKVAYYLHGLKCSVRMDVDELSKWWDWRRWRSPSSKVYIPKNLVPCHVRVVTRAPSTEYSAAA